MQQILAHEAIEADEAALRMLAHAARGSMRDGLSLLDQAIAYAGGKVTLEAVRGMLGAIDETTIVRVLDAVVAGDAAGVLALADEMNSASLSFSQALRDLASLLHRIALMQQAPVDDGPAAAEIARLARTLSPEEVQLHYQIALHGRNDLHLAPDEYAGFTMTLLRMLAFAPREARGTESVPAAARLRASPAVAVTSSSVPARSGVRAATASTPAAGPASTQTRVTRAATDGTTQAMAARPAAAPGSSPSAPTPPGDANPRDPLPFDGNWPALVARLKVSGLVKELAQRSELLAVEGDHFRLRVPLRALAEGGTVDKLRAAIEAALGRSLRVSTEFGSTAGPTAAGLAAQASAERQRQAEEAIYGDPFVRELLDNFGAAVDPASIRPRDGNDTGTKR
jgi:DNA polymerase-3 subunit gamma/tau